MSIVSDICADEGNAKKDQWVKKLQKALDLKDWSLVEKLIREMSKFYFSE